MCITQGSANLAANKQKIVMAVQRLGGTQENICMLVAMAMQETDDCCGAERDCSKDGTPSANYSCFNMNEDMLRSIGWTHDVDLNDEKYLNQAIFWMMTAWHVYGVDATLNFHRGGRQAFEDGHSYGAQEYRTAIWAVVNYLVKHPAALTDNTRVAFNLQHV